MAWTLGFPDDTGVDDKGVSSWNGRYLPTIFPWNKK